MPEGGQGHIYLFSPFPFFPWIGVSLLGAFVGSFKFKTPSEVFNKNLLLSGAVMFAVGVMMWLYFMPDVSTNENFVADVFYFVETKIFKPIFVPLRVYLDADDFFCRRLLICLLFLEDLLY